MSRKICVVTSTRAEYGLLSPLLRALRDEPTFDLQLVVTGSHLSRAHGETVAFIKADGFSISQEIPILDSSDTSTSVCKTMANALEKFGQAFEKNRPDLLILLGDRYETFAIAAAAQISKIPIAHLHGGETTEGAYDEAFRHSITKMSLLHFTATETYRRRVIQLGEHPTRVFNVGAIGLDVIRTLAPISREELGASLGLDLTAPYFLVTYHPETLGSSAPADDVDALCQALLATTGTTAIITKANADTGGDQINERLETWAARHPDRLRVFASLGQSRYLAAMRHSAGVVGNSSSGIIEAPQFHVPTLDIGDRQKGRLRSDSVIMCASDENSIMQGLARLRSAEVRDRASRATNPYGDGHTTPRIIAALKNWNPASGTRKSFYDWPSDPTHDHSGAGQS